MTDWAKVMREDWDARARSDLLRHIYRKQYPNLEALYQEGKHHAITLTFPVMQRLSFDPTGKRILEVGCGMGRLFPGFKELGFDEIWGIDVSQEMLERGRTLCPVTGANFVLGNGESLEGLESRYFDYCFSYNVFPCVPNAHIVMGYLEEVERVLRPGGAFQLHFRGGYTRKAGVLRLLPAKLRSPLHSTYRAVGSLRPGRNSRPSIETHYALGSLETWVGAKVSPGRVGSRLARLGLGNLNVYSDPRDTSDGETFWVSGQKQGLGGLHDTPGGFESPVSHYKR
jgi:ubiquinone/menaquinone biosynthesis C-methylase UbiE